MSRYADKKLNQAPCAIAACTETGTQLRILAGRPDWFCQIHANKVAQQ